MTMTKYHPLDDTYSAVRIIPSTDEVHVMPIRKNDQHVEHLTVQSHTAKEALAAHCRVGSQFFDLDVGRLLKYVSGGVWTVRQVMHLVGGDYAVSSTERVVTTNVFRSLAIAPPRAQP